MENFFGILKTSKPKNAAERVYFELKRMLLNYLIVPGQKLQCQDLAEKFKVSRTPVKDALSMLENEGFVERKPNKGYYVAEIGSEEAEHLYDVREALEVLAIQRVVEKVNQNSLQILKGAMDAYGKDIEMPLSRKRLIMDADFHLKIAEMTKNTALVSMLRMIFSKIYLKHRVENLSPQRSYEADKEHKLIYDAISSGKASVAVDLVRKHISQSRKNVLGRLGERSGSIVSLRE